MAPRTDALHTSPRRPSKLLMLLALAFAISLPFILVKMFPQEKEIKMIAHVRKDITLPHPSLMREQAYQNLHALETVYSKEIKQAACRKPKATGKSNDNTMIMDTARIAHQSAASKINNQPQADHTLRQQEVAIAPPESPKIPPPKTKKISHWKIIHAQTGDSLAIIFKRLGLSAAILQNMLEHVPQAKNIKIKPDQQLRFLIKNNTLEKMVLPFNQTQQFVVYHDGHRYKTKMNTKKTSSHNHFVTATIHGSLFGTAKRKHISFKLVQQMTQIFAWDINFARDIQDGDQFTIIYKALYVDENQVGIGDIVAVSFRNRGKLFQAIRHTAKQTGQTDYFTPQGMSAQKAFDRYPIRFSHISSTFSLSRYHPILHYNRAHHGVDLAARIGTPIQATGSGRIETIGRQGGYGNVIKIRHNKEYSTIYGHMLKFQKGLSKGSYVRRGQIIGYVGQSGLASGPHCHYEFRLHEQPKNPSTVQLPRSIPLSGRELAAFQSKADVLIAQMKLFESTQLAKQKINTPRNKVTTAQNKDNNLDDKG